MGENTVSDAELAALQASQDDVRLIEVPITSVEVLALNAAPKLLIPPPGPGNILEFISSAWILDFVSAAYATNGTLRIQTVTGNTVVTPLVLLAEFLNATADRVTMVQALSSTVADLDVNEGLELFMPTAETITGDSPLRLQIVYRVHATGL